MKQSVQIVGIVALIALPLICYAGEPKGLEGLNNFPILLLALLCNFLVVGTLPFRWPWLTKLMAANLFIDICWAISILNEFLSLKTEFEGQSNMNEDYRQWYINERYKLVADIVALTVVIVLMVWLIAKRKRAALPGRSA
jgi:hypothetical protein